MKKLLIAAAVVLLFVGLISEAFGSGTAEPAAEKIVIGHAPQIYDVSDYHGQLDIGLMRRAAELGLNLEIVARAPLRPNDYAGHNQIIEDFITLNVDYIVVHSSSPYNVITSLQSANKAGIPVIFTSYDRLIPEAETLTIAGYDQAEGGRIAADYALKNGLVGRGDDVVILSSMPGEHIGVERSRLFNETAKAAGVNIVYTGYTEWLREKAYEETLRIISAYPKVKLINAIASNPALGAAEAIASEGLTGKVHVFGYGCIGSEIDAIWEGTLTGAVFRNAQSNGEQVAEAIHLHQRGEAVPEWSGMVLSMVGSRAEILDIIPPEILRLTKNWPAMEAELKKLGKL